MHVYSWRYLIPSTLEENGVGRGLSQVRKPFHPPIGHMFCRLRRKAKVFQTPEHALVQPLPLTLLTAGKGRLTLEASYPGVAFVKVFRFKCSQLSRAKAGRRDSWKGADPGPFFYQV